MVSILGQIIDWDFFHSIIIGYFKLTWWTSR